MKRVVLVSVALSFIGAWGAWSEDSSEVMTAPVELALGDAPRVVTEYQGVVNNLFAEGRVLIAGQPDVEALMAFAAQGVTVVVNLRTPEEMADAEAVPFDEAEVVRKAGMAYVVIPLGGEDYPYSEAAVDQFAAVLQQHPGKILLHCRSAGRTSYLWVAYLIREQGISLDDAIARGEQMRMRPSPLEGLLGRDLHLVYGDGG